MARVKRRLLWAAAVLGGVVGAVLLFQYTALSGDLWVSNATPVDLEVSVGDRTLFIAAGQNLEMGRFGSGPRELVARRKADGVEIDRRPVVFNNSRTHVYNVLGAAPVLESIIEYTTSSVDNGLPPIETSLCGVDFKSLNAEYVFTQPPSSISMPKDTHQLRHTALSLQNGGASTCLQILSPQPKSSATLATRLANAAEDPKFKRGMSSFAAVGWARLGDAPAALALLGTDDSVETHRERQTIFKALGRQPEALETYRRRFEADRSALNAYLYARLLPAEEAHGVLLPWASSDEPWVHRALLWQAAARGDFDEVLTETERCLAKTPDADEDHLFFCVEERARARVAKGQAELALTELEDAFEKETIALETAILIERVALKTIRKPRFSPLSKLQRGSEPDLFKAFYELSVGLAASTPVAFRGFAVLEQARTDPGAALVTLERAPESARYLRPELTILLLGEALRIDQTGASTMLHSLLPPSVPMADLAAWVRDGVELDLTDFDEPTRAALLLARGRRLESVGDSQLAEAMYRRVRAADGLDGLAVRALKSWSGPAPDVTGALERVEGLQLERR